MKVGDRVRVTQDQRSHSRDGLTGQIGTIVPTPFGSTQNDLTWFWVRFDDTGMQNPCNEGCWDLYANGLELLSPGQEGFVSVQPEELDASIKVGDWVEMVDGDQYTCTKNGARGIVTWIDWKYILVDWKSGLQNDPGKSTSFNVLTKKCKKIPAQSVGQPQETISASATDKQTKDNNMVFRVTAILTPSVIAQQNGSVESVLIDNQSVVANDPGAAALVAGAKNADVVNKATGGTIRVVIGPGI